MLGDNWYGYVTWGKCSKKIKAIVLFFPLSNIRLTGSNARFASTLYVLCGISIRRLLAIYVNDTKSLKHKMPPSEPVTNWNRNMFPSYADVNNREN